VNRKDVKVGTRVREVATGRTHRVTRIGEHRMEVDLVDEASGRATPFVPMHQLLERDRFEPVEG
jgi:hypothetical protein